MLQRVQNFIEKATTAALTTEQQSLLWAQCWKVPTPAACPQSIIVVASYSMLFNTPQHTFQLLIQLSSQNRQEKQKDHFSPDLNFKHAIIYLYTAVFTHSPPAVSKTQSSVT